MPVKPCPFQNSGAAIDISKHLIHCPANTLLLDYFCKIASDRGGTDPCRAAWMTRKIMDRIRTEARGNRIRIGFVACLDIRFDYLFHALSNRGLRHSASLLSIAPGGMNGRYIPTIQGTSGTTFGRHRPIPVPIAVGQCQKLRATGMGPVLTPCGSSRQSASGKLSLCMGTSPGSVIATPSALCVSRGPVRVRKTGAPGKLAGRTIIESLM